MRAPSVERSSWYDGTATPRPVKPAVVEITVAEPVVTAFQFESAGKVRAVHVIPSVDEAAAFDGPVEMAAKIPVTELKVTEHHC